VNAVGNGLHAQYLFTWTAFGSVGMNSIRWIWIRTSCLHER